jgi:hypothetical protein
MMTYSFSVMISLGNEAMSTPQDVARSLQEVVNRLKRNDADEEYDSGRLYDVNGNSVGQWTYNNSSDQE